MKKRLLATTILTMFSVSLVGCTTIKTIKESTKNDNKIYKITIKKKVGKSNGF